MREKKNRLYLDNIEKTVLLYSLVELKNRFIGQGRYAHFLDEFICKVACAPVTNLKIA